MIKLKHKGKKRKSTEIIQITVKEHLFQYLVQIKIKKFKMVYN